MLGSWDSTVTRANGLLAENEVIVLQYPQKCPDRFWDPQILLFISNGCHVPQGKTAGACNSTLNFI